MGTGLGAGGRAGTGAGDKGPGIENSLFAVPKGWHRARTGGIVPGGAGLEQPRQDNPVPGPAEPFPFPFPHPGHTHQAQFLASEENPCLISSPAFPLEEPSSSFTLLCLPV